MNTVWRNLKELAKRNTAVRVCMIGIYAIAFTLRALWRRRLRVRKKLAACLVIFSLCFFRMFAAVVYAETAGVSGNDTAAVSPENPDPENGSGSDAGSGSEKDGSGSGMGSGSEEEGSGGGAGSVSENGGSGSVSGNTGDGTVSGGDTENGGGSGADISNNDVSDNGVSSNDASGNDVTGNDVTDNDISSNDVTGNDVTDNDAPAEDGGGVSDNDVSNNDVSSNDIYTYVPQLFIDCRLNRDPAGVLTGNASSKLVLSTVSSYIEPLEGDTAGISPAVRVWEEINGERYLIDLSTGKAEISFPSDFYGTVTFTAEDSLGNTSVQTTPLLLIDASAPSADIVEELQPDGSKRLTAVFKEDSRAASGIGETRCFIDGAEVQMPDFRIDNVMENCFGRAVISETGVPVIIEKPGTYTVTLLVKDNAGNGASYERVVEMPEALPISVRMPTKVGMTIEPYRSEGPQIYTDVCTIENRSGYDVTALLRSVTLTVDRGNVNGDASKKDCDLFLSYDGAQDVALPEGNTKDFLSAVIPAKKEDGSNGTLTLRVYGWISEGSAGYWRSGDIKLNLGVEYKAKGKEE